MTHTLKTWPEYFIEIEKGRKKFDLRKEDRLFEIGDKIILQEFDPGDGYSGKEIEKVASYILRGPVFGLKKGHCIISLEDFSQTDY